MNRLVPAALPALAALALTATAANATCASNRGDLGPGLLEESPGSVPTWRPQGDGAIDVADVVALLNVTVGRVRFGVPEPGAGHCPLVVGDFSPGRLDESTTPPTWRPLGDGRVNVGDVVALLRATVGLQDIVAPERHARLRRVNGCAELEQWLKQAALQGIEAHGHWSYGWWWDGGPEPGVDFDGTAVPPNRESGAGSHSDTNVQVAGVDEADLVETDGHHVYFLATGRLHVFDAWPVEDMRLVSSTSIEGQPTGMYLHGQLAVVLSSVQHFVDPGPGIAADVFWEWGTSKLSVFDVTDPAAPKLRRELYLEGSIQSSRRHGDRLTLVSNHVLRGPEVALEAAADWTERMELMKRAVEESTLEDWAPRYLDVTHGPGGTVSRLVPVLDCDTAHRPDTSDGAGLTTLLSLDLADPAADLQGASVLSATTGLHASADRLYLTSSSWTTPWWFTSTEPQPPTTRVHAFDLGDQEPKYLGSGEVPGVVLNQFSLDEHDGHVRVATTTGMRWAGDTATAVSVLALDGEENELPVVGHVGGLAPGETVQSVRFDGDVAWVVTFLVIDPLFAIDLSEPSLPRVTGELEVTGFSSYLHLLDDGHLIGVGTEVDPETQRTVGVQVSLFDVSDLAAPGLDDRVVLEASWSASDAQTDHHAFNYFEELSALSLPFVSELRDPSGTSSSFNGLRVFRITPERGIEDLGGLNLDSIPELQPTHPTPSPWCRQVRRSVFLEDRLVALSPAGVVGVAIDALDEPLAVVPLDPEGCWY